MVGVAGGERNAGEPLVSCWDGGDGEDIEGEGKPSRLSGSEVLVVVMRYGSGGRSRGGS